MQVPEYFIFIFIALIIGIEFLWPHKTLKFLRQGFLTDLVWYLFVQSFLLRLLVFRYYEQFHPPQIHIMSHMPLYLQFILFLFMSDFLEYWLHRLSHYSDILWRTHEVHHTTTELTWLSAGRQHALELIFARGITTVIFAFLDVSVVVIGLVGLVDGMFAFFIHSNVNLKMGRLKYFFNSPEMHRVHHLANKRCHFSNYGNKFSIWDWMFGTAYLPRADEHKETFYGIGYYYPQEFYRQLFFLFRKK